METKAELFDTKQLQQRCQASNMLSLSFIINQALFWLLIDYL